MKTFNVLLFLVGMYSVAMYGSENEDRSCYFGNLGTFSFEILNTMSLEQRNNFAEKARYEMVYGSVEERQKIFSPSNGLNGTSIGSFDINSPRDRRVIVENSEMNSKILAQSITYTNSPVGSPVVIIERKKATCLSRLLHVLTRKNNRVYAAVENGNE